MFGMLVQSTDSLLAVGAFAASVWAATWPYLLMLLGFSLIVFVHELGHFAVAKWADVRVEKFAIGFGRELFGFTKGETRYSFNLLPLGGYVKMLGQEDFDDKSNELKFKEDPRSFVNKPVGRRMAIVSAGVIMNILFACLLFMVVFLLGMEVIAPKVGYVEPDSPAERAGLQSGDVIRRVNGDKALEFDDVLTGILLAPPHEPVEFVVERNGEMVAPLAVKPDYRHPDFTRDLQRQVVGIGPGVTREIVDVGPPIKPLTRDRPKVGDKLVEINGVAITDENVGRMVELLGSVSGPVVVERSKPEDPASPPQRVEVRIPPRLGLYPSDPKDPSTVSVLGLRPLVRFSLVDPKGRAYLAGIEAGDTVLRWNDIDYPSSAQIASAIRDNPERDIPFSILKPQQRVPQVGAVRPKRNRNGPATVQALCVPISTDEASASGPRAKFTHVARGGIAHQAGIESGDAIQACNGVTHPTAVEVNRILRQGKGKPIELVVERTDGRTLTTVVRPQAPGSIDAKHDLVAEDVMLVGEVVEKLQGKPSPAAAAGIPTGARITAVGGKPVARWIELIEALRAAAGTSVEVTYKDARQQDAVATMAVPHCLRTKLGIGPEGRILRIAGKETVTTQGPRGDEDISIRYHEGTRLMLTQLIGQTGVPVEFRRDLLSPVEKSLVDVSADLVDPWLGRIALTPGARLGSEMKLLKGDNALDAVRIGLHKTYYFVVQVYQILHRMIFSRSVSVESMSGPLGIINIGGQIAQTNQVRFLWFLAMLSANLAVINFLPLPIVDGGLMVFLIIEKIKGSPVSLRVQVATQMIGVFLIIGAFVYVTYIDALRMWG
jgi:membrane-associated protease RseP (regulator of RpoE activity)